MWQIIIMIIIIIVIVTQIIIIIIVVVVVVVVVVVLVLVLVLVIITGWHYLSNATCLVRPRLFYACFVVSRTTIIRYMILHFSRTPVLDK